MQLRPDPRSAPAPRPSHGVARTSGRSVRWSIPTAHPTPKSSRSRSSPSGPRSRDASREGRVGVSTTSRVGSDIHSPCTANGSWKRPSSSRSSWTFARASPDRPGRKRAESSTARATTRPMATAWWLYREASFLGTGARASGKGGERRRRAPEGYIEDGRSPRGRLRVQVHQLIEDGRHIGRDRKTQRGPLPR
jgi:hypothetical protein